MTDSFTTWTTLTLRPEGFCVLAGDVPIACTAAVPRLCRGSSDGKLDLGCSDHVYVGLRSSPQQRSPSQYRTRVITRGVISSLHVDYKHSRIKQYCKRTGAR